MSDTPSITDRLRALGLETLGENPAPEAIDALVRRWVESLEGADEVQVAGERNALVGRGVPANLVDAALKTRVRASADGRFVRLTDAEPWPDPVDGVTLLDDISSWIGAHVWIPAESAHAIALWVVTTWFVENVYFAPILSLLSPTKQCAKTLLFDLMAPVVRRGYLTSGPGITPAVMFRLNDRDRPTFLIDEAEKLAGRRADRELISMLNVGHRRGGHVARCVETGGDYDVVDFDAFGFRALAAIGTLWDTVVDRSIVVRMDRKPKSEKVDRFAAKRIEADGRVLARKIRRWADDHRDDLVRAVAATADADEAGAS